MASNTKPSVVPTGKPIDSRSIAVSNPLDVGSVYANEFGVGLTVTDMRLIFAEVGIDVTGNAPSKTLKANVVVPLQGAEALARQILAALDQHKAAIEQHKKSLQANATPEKS